MLHLCLLPGLYDYAWLPAGRAVVNTKAFSYGLIEPDPGLRQECLGVLRGVIALHHLYDIDHPYWRLVFHDNTLIDWLSVPAADHGNKLHRCDTLLSTRKAAAPS
jgi:hypothetical protein